MAKERTFSLSAVLTDGWFERIGEGIGSFQALCDIVGEAFFAFSMITGVRITALTVDRRGDAEPHRHRLRARLERHPKLHLELVEELVEVAAEGALGGPVEDVLLGIDDPDGHLRPAEIRPDRGPHRSACRQEIRRGMRY